MATATVTVVFTDLVGSTELLSRVGESVAEELRREHFTLLRAAVSDAGGREVKNLGDGLMVAFDGVTAALACAVAMQQALAARPASAEPLSIRVGIAVGEADVEDGDYFGLPVVEAARLCARAEGGEILTTAFVRMMARSRGGFEMEPIGELELKGLAEPVEAWRVRWEPLARIDDDGVPVPRQVDLVAQGVVVGRRSEREALVEAFKAAEAGERQAVLLSGEPGIGKTTLASSFAVEAATHGASVLFGRCDEDLLVPYQPWVGALAHLVEYAPDELVGDHVRACGTVLGRVVPELWRRTATHAADRGDEEEESDRHLLYAAVVDLLSRASAATPLVLLLDDLHWADAASVQLMRHVLAASRPMRLLLIGTFRDSDVGPEHVLADALAALHREPGVARVALRGLTDVDLLELLEGVAGHEMTDDGIVLRDALLAETEGNPFFVGELLRHLVDTDAIRQDDDGRWVAAIDLDTVGLPVSIREVVGRRVIALGPETARVLGMAAVIGRDFDLELLERVVDLDGDHLLTLCDAAVDAAVLREGDRAETYSFAHALIERALYDELSLSRRTRAHRAVAEAIEELCDGHVELRASELAHHWARATRPQDAGKAVAYARLAGDRALAALAPTEALRWYQEGLELLDEPQRRSPDALRLRVGVGETQRLLGDPAYRETQLSVARDAAELGDVEVLTRAALASNRGWPTSLGHVDHERVAMVRAALDAVGPADSADRARLLGVLANELSFDWEAEHERLALAADAVAMARRVGDDRTFVDVVARVAFARTIPETTADRVRDAEEACTIADRLGDPLVRLLAHWAAGFAAIDTADRASFDRHRETIESMVAQIDAPIYRHIADNHRVFVAQLDGDPDAADQAATDYWESSAEGATHMLLPDQEGEGPDPGVVVWTGTIVATHWMRGLLANLLPVIEVYIVEQPDYPIYRPVLAWILALEGEEERALDVLAEWRERDFGLRHDSTWLLANLIWAEAAFRTDDVVSAERLCPRLEAHPDLLANSRASLAPICAHAAGLVRAVMGDLDEAVLHLEHAIEVHEELRAPYFLAYSQVALGEILRRRDAEGDARRARELLTVARSVGQERGYGYVVRDADAVVVALDDATR